MTQYRAVFDARVEFVNGGGLSVDGFRLDVPGPDLDSAQVARLFVQHLGLALVGDVTFSSFAIFAEQHKGSRGTVAPQSAADAAAIALVDLSHTLRAELVTYPGVPPLSIEPLVRRGDGAYAPGTSFSMDIITIPGNTGTYLDTAWHRYEGGDDLTALELSTLVDLPAEVFHLTDATTRGIPASVFFDRDVRGKAVLLHTGWDRLFGTPEYGAAAPFLTAEAVEYLVDQGVTLVGIDSLNIDDTTPDAAGERPAHTRFLAERIHVVEHLTNLGDLPSSGALFTAVPPKIAGTGTFTVRAFAKIPA